MSAQGRDQHAGSLPPRARKPAGAVPSRAGEGAPPAADAVVYPQAGAPPPEGQATTLWLPSTGSATAQRTLMWLQHVAGNVAVQHLVQRKDPPPASMPLPNQSTMPAPAERPIVHEGVQLAPDQKLLRNILERMVAAKGEPAMDAWAYRFINMSVEQKIGHQLYGVDMQRLEDTRIHLKEAVLKLEHDNKEFLTQFEARAIDITREVLNNSEKQIKEQLQKLGITSTEIQFGENTTTHYSMSNKEAGAAIQKYARDLAAKRREANRAANAMLRAQSDVYKWTSNNPFIIPQGLTDTAKKAHEDWKQQEEAYNKLRKEREQEYPILAVYATGDDAVAKLEQLAAVRPEQLAQSLGVEAQKRLQNIDRVRAELGGRFKVWRQSHLLSITKQQMNATPMQARVIHDKAQKEAADEEASKMLFAAVAIGLGLLAAIPTGGSSALAGIATAAAVVGAGASIYGAYEHLQEYMLESAAGGTAFDKANAIAKDDPSLLWLALDIVAAVTDVGAAAAAFKTLKASMEAARASKLHNVRDLVDAGRKVGLSGEAQGRLVAAVVDSAGGKAAVKVTLEDIAAVFKKLDPQRIDARLARAFQDAARHMMDLGRVAVVGQSPVERMATIRQLVAPHLKDEAEISRVTRSLAAKLDQSNVGGFYSPHFDIILVKGEGSAESVAACLAHELAHHKQELWKGLKNIEVYEQEFQAFSAQRSFLRGLPIDAVPEDWQWLWLADNAAIERHVLEAYQAEGAFKPQGFSNQYAAEEIIRLLRKR
jgi:hypothetical protein